MYPFKKVMHVVIMYPGTRPAKDLPLKKIISNL